MVELIKDYQKAFDKLKVLFTDTPMMEFPDYSKQLKVYIEVSGLGLGAVLYQTQGYRPNRVISYASRTLSKIEGKYPTCKLELLALN